MNEEREQALEEARIVSTVGENYLKIVVKCNIQASLKALFSFV